MARVGIMGGTFDPVHFGHLLLGRQAKKEYDLDQIWFMPSGQPPHKTDRFVTEASHRCSMVKLAIKGEDGFSFSDFETRRQGNTYTAETISLLKETWPQHHFFFILGADSLYQIERWFHPELVVGHVDILAARRESDSSHVQIEKQIRYLTEKYGGWIGMLHGPELDVSSEQIRSFVRNEKPIVQFVPDTVADYIKEHRLYMSAPLGSDL